MILKFGQTVLIPFALLLCTLRAASTFNFPDFNIYEESSSTMDKACSMFATMIEWINFADPKIEDISFQMRNSCERIQFDMVEADLLRRWKGFNPNLKTAVLVTGWNSDLYAAYTEELTNAFVCRGDYNLIVVNTSNYLKTEYIKSAYNTEKIGKFIAVGLKNLEIPGKDLHLIGHSLGAHTVGSAARHFTATTGDKIARITGLDPARPCFHNHSVFSRLREDDALFVDIIHSNPGETGLEEPIGHVDFYPGGLNPQQVGCSLINVKCSHIMSVDYFTETVYSGNQRNFMASQCGNYTDLQTLNCHKQPMVPMGLAATKDSKGIFFLTVNGESPYGMNAKKSDYLKIKAECGLCNE